MAVILLIVTVIAVLALWALIEFWTRWRLAQLVASEQQDVIVLRPRLEPESRFVVQITEEEVVCERPDGKVERVTWADLQKVEVVTTSEGPYVPDVFFVLHGSNGGCAIPQGATGESQLLDRLFALPGFDNGPFIQAMTSTSDARFLCWQKPG